MSGNYIEKQSIQVLVYEYITGGGLSGQTLPDSLAREGRLMLESLINDLAMATSYKIIVLLDWRFQSIDLPHHMEKVVVGKNQSVNELLPLLIEQADYIWPIAPEMDGILYNITALVESKSKRLLNSSLEAVRICSDKLITTEFLSKSHVKTIESIQLNQFSGELLKPWVIKRKDGAGCIENYLVSSDKAFDEITRQIQHKENYIVQPYIKGDSLSLSCLFKGKKAWLLCCNRQKVIVQNQCFKLLACDVNISDYNVNLYHKLINQVALAIPGLWGYVGIDLILVENEFPIVLEVNSRLTTSYVGIAHAMQINVAHTVLKMVDKDPCLPFSINETVFVQY